MTVAVSDVQLPPSPAPSPESDAVIRAAQATLRAEELQRAQTQAREPTSIEQRIDAIPGLNDWKRQYLKARPELMLDPIRQQAMAQAYHEAINAGIDDDSPAMNEALDRGIAARLERLRQTQALASAPLHFDEPEPAPAPRELPPAAPPMQHHAPAPQAPPPEIRRSMPITAPVSREVPTTSGQRYPRQITLSGEERQIARLSFAHLPPDQAEAAYAANKAKMLQLKAEGIITDQGG